MKNGKSKMFKVSKVKVNNENLKESIIKAVNLIGGFESFIDKGDVVFIKPNFNTADPFPASTDMEFLKIIVEIIYSFGAKLVMIADSSTMTLNTRKIMERKGVFDLLKIETPPRIYVLEEEEWLEKEIPLAKYLKKVKISSLLERADKLIFLPCLKTHKYAQFTGSLKLAVGLMEPKQRIGLHLTNIQEKIAELNVLFNPNLIIMDARKCFINKGPVSGEIREPNLILASDDRVAIDIEGINVIQEFKGNSLVGINPWELPQIKRAVELKIGSIDETDYEVINS